MVIWSGFGILVPVIAFVFFMGSVGVTSAISGNEDYISENMWPVSTAMLLAAAAIWFVGRWLHSGTGRVMVDKESGREVVLQRRHTLFWIKFEYWAIVPAALGLLYTVMDLIA